MFKSGDVLKTNENLIQILRTENEFTVRAEPWALIVTSGIAQGYYDLAEIYEGGAKVNRTNPGAFRKYVSFYRNSASAAAMQFTETIHKYMDKRKDASIALVFGFPVGNANEPPQLKKIGSGIPLPEAEVELVERAMVQRGALRATCKYLGLADNPAKVQEAFKQGEVKVSRDVFLLSAANALYDQSQLFSPSRLDQPKRAKVMCTEALEALAAITPSKESKALTQKIQALVKKLKVADPT